MTNVSELRALPRLRILLGLCLSLMVAMAWAQPAQADTKVVTGGETRLEVNVANFVKLLGDGIFVTAIPPARLEYGAQPGRDLPGPQRRPDRRCELDRDRPARRRPADGEVEHRPDDRYHQHHAHVRAGGRVPFARDREWAAPERGG